MVHHINREEVDGCLTEGDNESEDLKKMLAYEALKRKSIRLTFLRTTDKA
jgi:hypothetical protein